MQNDELTDALDVVEMKLAERLFNKMEHLDPSPDGMPCEWDEMRDCDKRVWTVAVHHLLLDTELVEEALRLMKTQDG